MLKYGKFIARQKNIPNQKKIFHLNSISALGGETLPFEASFCSRSPSSPSKRRHLPQTSCHILSSPKDSSENRFRTTRSKGPL